MEKILIIGLGVSGSAAARLLSSEADVSVWDSKPEEGFEAGLLSDLRARGVKLLFEDFPSCEGWDELVLSPGVSPEIAPVQACKAAGARITGELEVAYRHCRGSFIAITGTNGKTTTTALTGEMVRAAGRDVSVVGNIGLPVADCAAAAGENTVMVTEVSSFQLETTVSFKPAVSAILNITPDHQDRHHSMEEYARVKHLIHANQDESGYFVFNADDRDLARACLDMNIRAKCVPFSHELGEDELSRLSRGSGCYAFVKDEYICICHCGRLLRLCRAADIKIPGIHNLENALAASACAYFGGIDAKAVTSALLSFPGVEHRIEFVREVNGVRYVNDSKGTNTDAAQKAIQATATPVLLIAGGYDKGSEFDDLFKVFEGKVKYLLLLGKTAVKIAETAERWGFPPERIVFCKDMEECVARGARLSEPGDTVLLSPACASWDMYKSYEHRGDHFKSLVNKL